MPHSNLHYYNTKKPNSIHKCLEQKKEKSRKKNLPSNIKSIVSDILYTKDKLSKRILTINSVNLKIIGQFYSIFSSILNQLYNNPILHNLYNDEQYDDLEIINNSYENFKFNHLTKNINDLNIVIDTQFNTFKELIDKFMDDEDILNNINELYEIKQQYSQYNNFTSLSNYMNPLYIECLNLYILSHRLLNNTCIAYSDSIPSSIKETIFDNLKNARLLFHQLKDNIDEFELLVNDNN